LIYLSERKLLGLVRDITFFRWCGIRRIIGAPFAYELRHAQLDCGTGMVEREAERLARCLADLGPIDVRDRSLWDLRLQRHEIDSAWNSLASLGEGNFIAVNLGGKVHSRDWGDANWITLLRLMTPKYSGLALVFFGSEDEFSRADQVGKVWPGSVINLCG